MLQAIHTAGWAPDHGHWFFVFPLLWLAIVAAVVIFAGRRYSRGALASSQAVLAERYARGEITEDEYRSARSILRERGR